MFKAIREFHNRTLDKYNEIHKVEMEDWKLHVMKLHESSAFLFYYENCELAEPDGSLLTVQGELARDLREGSGKNPGNRTFLYLYDGQGELLGEGILMSDPYEKEEKRRGFLRLRKNECNIRIETLYGKPFASLSEKGKRTLLARFFSAVSLISDAGPTSF